MDTSWKEWALTLGTSAVAVTIALGHEHIIVSIGARVVNLFWRMVSPLGPM